MFEVLGAPIDRRLSAPSQLIVPVEALGAVGAAVPVVGAEDLTFEAAVIDARPSADHIFLNMLSGREGEGSQGQDSGGKEGVELHSEEGWVSKAVTEGKKRKSGCSPGRVLSTKESVEKRVWGVGEERTLLLLL
jgi:hypothetical protein